MTTPVSAPRPVPRSISAMSRRRAGARLMKYSPSPERESRRVITTSRKGTGSDPSSFSKWSETSARFTGRRAEEPWKITSSILEPRRSRARCSPSTQRTASDTFDLPHPLGPTIAVTPGSKTRSVESANDLKPCSSSLVSLTSTLSRYGRRALGEYRMSELRRRTTMLAPATRTRRHTIAPSHQPDGARRRADRGRRNT